MSPSAAPWIAIQQALEDIVLGTVTCWLYWHGHSTAATWTLVALILNVLGAATPRAIPASRDIDQ